MCEARVASVLCSLASEVPIARGNPNIYSKQACPRGRVTGKTACKAGLLLKRLHKVVCLSELFAIDALLARLSTFEQREFVALA